jgi:hypothetical protein
MGKRKRPSNNISADTELSYDDSPKRSRPEGSNNAPVKQQSVSYGRVDPNSGQRSAIPGLDDYSAENGENGEQEYEDDETEDALRYLRSVRQVFSSIAALDKC